MCYYYLICKKCKDAEFKESTLTKFKNYFYINDFILKDDDRFDENSIKELSDQINNEIGNSSFFLLVHFGGISDLHDFCNAISQWKKILSNDKLKAILPISSKASASPAFELYQKLKDGFDNIEDLNLDHYMKIWEVEYNAVKKKKIIAKLLGLALLIETAEIAREKNDFLIFEKTKAEIETEIESQFDFSQRFFTNLPEETKSLQEIIDAVKALFTLKIIKDSKQIFKDIKDLKDKLEGRQKS